MDNKQLNKNYSAAVRLWGENKGFALEDLKDFVIRNDSDGSPPYIDNWAVAELKKPTREQLKTLPLTTVRSFDRAKRRIKDRATNMKIFHDEESDQLVISYKGELRPILLGPAIVI